MVGFIWIYNDIDLHTNRGITLYWTDLAGIILPSFSFPEFLQLVMMAIDFLQLKMVYGK